MAWWSLITPSEREQILALWGKGHSISFIACKLALTREYVRTVIKEHNYMAPTRSNIERDK